MKKTSKFYKSHKKLTWILIVCILVVLFYGFTWDCPEVFHNAGVWLTVIETLALSYIASFIFYVLQVYIPDENRIETAKKLYLNELNNEYLNLVSHILWLDERLNDKDFDWNLSPKEYFTLGYMLAFEGKYPSKTITFEEAKRRLNELHGKYSLDAQKKMDIETLDHVQRMFLILGTSSQRLAKLVSKFHDNEIEIDSVGILSLKQVQDIVNSTSMALMLMLKKNKNYGFAVAEILRSYEIIRTVGDYKDKIVITCNGTVSMMEL